MSSASQRQEVEDLLEADLRHEQSSLVYAGVGTERRLRAWARWVI
jgi:hypothetical protein